MGETKKHPVRKWGLGLRYRYTHWAVLAGIPALLVAIPFLTILAGLLKGPGANWPHLVQTVLPDYVLNSLLLLLYVGSCTLVVGTACAWLVTTCQFPGRRFFSGALILPLALPTYIVAFVYAGITDYTGPLQRFLRGPLGFSHEQASVDIMNMGGIVFVLSAVLYPYVYVLARGAFQLQSRSLLESARMLGSGAWRMFFGVALPIARPALAGGLFLVLMELLNDYGAVKYYGISTFTTGIFRSWFSLGDLQAAVYLSGLLLLLIGLLIALERWQRGKARYHAASSAQHTLTPFRLRGLWAFAAFLACLLPFLAGFALPVLQLVVWAAATAHKVVDARFWELMGNSLRVSAGAALLCVLLALVLVFAGQLSRGRLLKVITRLSTLGYAIPGAVIAVGVLIPLLGFDRQLSGLLGSLGGKPGGLLLTGTIFGLLMAYVVRFLAVAYNPADAGIKRVSPYMLDAARSLGYRPLAVLWHVYLPLLRGPLLSAALLVFVDAMKELPLTLILRPFNFHTLATKAFELAGDEMIAESASPALVIVLSGLLPVLLLNTLITVKPRAGAKEPVQKIPA
ncbi:ABC transporter permease [Cesiribacter andamanensis]|uniref:Sulfate transport system permease protein CysW n=1 Tax=Cesiribacter andamanensis AMV16 TaxID=1279009 RepID=M7NKU5_9BACT|nr:iron ABC transporter permease [Cesiribacter andamanensis]EMR02415.1 Sulfate transport system permease protein CysW [Cesiribacter andamanensis AMV16]